MCIRDRRYSVQNTVHKVGDRLHNARAKKQQIPTAIMYTNAVFILLQNTQKQMSSFAETRKTDVIKEIKREGVLLQREGNMGQRS